MRSLKYIMTVISLLCFTLISTASNYPVNVTYSSLQEEQVTADFTWRITEWEGDQRYISQMVLHSNLNYISLSIKEGADFKIAAINLQTQEGFYTFTLNPSLKEGQILTFSAEDIPDFNDESNIYGISFVLGENPPLSPHTADISIYTLYMLILLAVFVFIFSFRLARLYK